MPPRSPRCPRCGSTIPRLAEHGLCPGCLLDAALADDPGDLEIDRPFPYRIITLLGGDDAAVTYLAQTMGGAPRQVALKIVRPCADPAAIVSRFARWKPVLADFRHPGVAALLDVGRLGPDSIFIATEYVAGSSLEPLLHDPEFDRTERAEVVRQIGAALSAAHERGLAHMRLELSRIKIAAAPGMRAIVLGFGSALVLEDRSVDPQADRDALQRIARELGVPPAPE
jgi:eukaryotic-like serine/threonine-protein kinase